MTSSASAHPNTKYLKINAVLNPARDWPQKPTTDLEWPSGMHKQLSHVHTFHKTQRTSEGVPSFSARVEHRNTRRSLRDTSFSAYRKYLDEEVMFITYHRQYLSLDWDEVLRRFNQRFTSRRRPGFKGIQSVFYRYRRRQIKNHP
ncbi:hypothetical protein PENSUB_4338 [Penicillium subrubescens]|uniref:Uncharacterized protein n=1 Tax=Penicillium subrubescens TaxID=1316194 RepID=A0A1Q5UCR5_9EURO|nr:hypothetical protein PENSUB_4338 [Penicillium subrubescens]